MKWLLFIIIGLVVTILTSGIFFTDGYILNLLAKNPSYTQLESFMDNYETRLAGGNCKVLTIELHNRAEQTGIKAGTVRIQLRENGHLLNLFETTDRGMVYIDMVCSKKITTWDTITERYEYISEIQESK